jgi:predicted TIM-barrel fold metal-dependent hydrolase
MIIDAHVHMGKGRPGGPSQTPEELIDRMDEGNVDRCVVFPFPNHLDNDYTAAAARKYHDRLIAFAFVNPKELGAPQELERCFRDLNLKGLKLHSYAHGYTLKERKILDPLFEICASYDKSILIHSNSDHPSALPEDFGTLAAAFPKVRLILGHMSFPNGLVGYEAAIAISSRHPNLYLDSTICHTWSIYRAVTVAGPEKVVMGSDVPFNHFQVSQLTVRLAVKDPAVRRLLMGENIQRIIG